MIKKFCKHYHEGSLTLRDYLAAHRTILANDRTWLAYVRTALTLFIGGVSFVRFFTIKILIVIGWAFIPLGVIVLIFGLWKYSCAKKMIHSIKHSNKKIEEI